MDTGEYQRKDLVRRGRNLRKKLVAGLQSLYGVESFELLVSASRAPAEAAEPPDERAEGGEGTAGRHWRRPPRMPG